VPNELAKPWKNSSNGFGTGSTGRWASSGGTSVPAGGQVEQHGGELAAGDAVDDRVVDLGQHRHPAALEALDHPELPEGLPTVELDAHQVADQVPELLGASGRRDADAAHVQVDVEVRVLDEHRSIDAERHLDEAPAELGREVQPLGDPLLQEIDAEALGSGGGVGDEHGRHVHVPRGGLAVEEGGVDAAHPLHGAASPGALGAAFAQR
jgi:hypothetical protein